MFEIQYDKNEMTLSYERGNVVFLVTLDWWWDEYTRDRIFDKEWITIDFNILEAEWWVEGKPEIHQITPTILYKEWIAEELEKMRHSEGFLFDDMREEIESIHEDRYEDYGI